MNRLRVAVVGAGWWGEQHLRAFSARADVEVVGVLGRTAERTGRRADAYGVTPYTDLDALLAAGRPDLITVSLPNQEHFVLTRQLLDTGIPLLVEKPLVFHLDEADELLAAAAARGTFFAVCFNHRYAEGVQRARTALEDGLLGDVVLASWHFGIAGPADHLHGNLIETQCHGLDALEHLVGPVAAVSAAFARRTRPEANTTLALSLDFESGAVGTLTGSYDDAPSGQSRMDLLGSKGRVVVEDAGTRFRYRAHDSRTAEVWEADPVLSRFQHFCLTLDSYLDDMLAAFRAGQAPPVPATAGRRALELAHAAITAVDTGRRQSVGAMSGSHGAPS